MLHQIILEGNMLYTGLILSCTCGRQTVTRFELPWNNTGTGPSGGASASVIRHQKMNGPSLEQHADQQLLLLGGLACPGCQ